MVKESYKGSFFTARFGFLSLKSCQINIMLLDGGPSLITWFPCVLSLVICLIMLLDDDSVLTILACIVGVQTATAEFSSGKVTVTGTMDANKLVDYVYRRTRKQARIVPQPDTEPEKEENKEAEKPAEEAKPAEENTEKEEEEKPAAEEGKKEEGGKENGEGNNEDKGEKGGEESKEEANKEGGGDPQGAGPAGAFYIDEENMKRMMYYYHAYPPLYVIERVPAPQLFSDENPNACCIS